MTNKDRIFSEIRESIARSDSNRAERIAGAMRYRMGMDHNTIIQFVTRAGCCPADFDQLLQDATP